MQVTTLRQELEDFLKDDDDMAKMCLSRKRDQATQWAAANAQGSSPSARPVLCIAVAHPSTPTPRTQVLQHVVRLRHRKCAFESL